MAARKRRNPAAAALTLGCFWGFRDRLARSFGCATFRSVLGKPLVLSLSWLDFGIYSGVVGICTTMYYHFFEKRSVSTIRPDLESLCRAFFLWKKNSKALEFKVMGSNCLIGSSPTKRLRVPPSWYTVYPSWVCWISCSAHPSDPPWRPVRS